MGVYVKGMNMPQSCITCRMECIVRLHDSTKRSKDCPLVEVPTPHGRLIDADDIKTITVACTERGCIKHIDAPTVIEREE